MKYGIAFGLIGIAFVWLASQSPWFWLGIWFAVAFETVAVSYFLSTPVLFGKRSDGSRQWWAWLLLLPYLVFVHAAWTMQLLFERSAPMHRLGSSVIMARRLRPREIPSDVTAVLDLTCEFLDPIQIRSRDGYHTEPTLDAGGMDVERALYWAKLARELEGPILVHCANGSGRTGHVVAIWLIAWGMADSPEDAIQKVQAARPVVRLNRRQIAQVQKAFEAIRSESIS
ncbi:hypothetical protein GC197_05250 [bacterium]|nr:hypothetical protein [bacterium]